MKLLIILFWIGIGVLMTCLLNHHKTSSIDERPSEPKEKSVHCPFPNGAEVINERGEIVDVLRAKSALLLNFLLNHPDKEMSTYELGSAIGLDSKTVEGASLALRRHEWIVYKRDPSDYYDKIVLTEKGKKLYLISK